MGCVVLSSLFDIWSVLWITCQITDKHVMSYSLRGLIAFLFLAFTKRTAGAGLYTHMPIYQQRSFHEQENKSVSVVCSLYTNRYFWKCDLCIETGSGWAYNWLLQL